MSFFTIHIGGFTLSEPSTAVTDFLLALICTYIIVHLQKLRSAPSIIFWQLFFGAMALSTFTGIFVHGFRSYQNETAQYRTWMIMNIISGASVCFAQMATLKSILRNSSRKLFYLRVARLQAAAYLLCLVFIRPFSFNVVVIQVAAGMIPVMILNFYFYNKGVKGCGWIGTGISLSFLSAVCRLLKLSLNDDWFNFNDLSHVFIGASFILMYRGILALNRMNSAGPGASYLSVQEDCL